MATSVSAKDEGQKASHSEPQQNQDFRTLGLSRHHVSKSGRFIPRSRPKGAPLGPDKQTVSKNKLRALKPPEMCHLGSRPQLRVQKQAISNHDKANILASSSPAVAACPNRTASSPEAAQNEHPWAAWGPTLGTLSWPGDRGVSAPLQLFAPGGRAWHVCRLWKVSEFVWRPGLDCPLVCMCGCFI